MKRLAWMSWVLAMLLALLIIWQQRQSHASRHVTVSVPAPELALWAPPRPAMAAQASADVVSEPSAALAPSALPAPMQAPLAKATPSAATEAVMPAKPGACARLGIFPDADWAAQVGQLLLPKSEQKGGLTWVVRAYPGQRYYVVFSGLDADALAQRLTARKALLRRRVTASAHPEGCS